MKRLPTCINYLPINDGDIKCGMYVKGVGFQSIPQSGIYPAKGHPENYAFNPKVGRTIDSYALVYLIRGEGAFASSTIHSKRLKKGCAFLLFPKEWHSYRPAKRTGWDEYWVSFSGSCFERFIATISSKTEPFFNIGIDNRIVTLFSEMITCAQEQKIGFQRVLTGILLHILGLVYAIAKSEKLEDRNAELIQQACIIIRGDTQFATKPENIAEMLNLSYSNFRKLFKHHTGLAPLQYALQLKIEKAKELLVSTDESVKKIALQLNFESTDYFSSFFSAKAGICPNEYRKTARKNG